MISSPLRSRFGMNCRLDYYGAEELSSIVLRTGGLLGVQIDEEGAMEVARRSRGTPRIANNLLRWVRDFAQVRAKGNIDRETASKALEMLDIDEEGFDEMDQRIIEAIIHKFGGGPVGVNSLAVAVGEEAGTLEDVHEPYLIMQGYLSRTPQGRVAMSKAYRKIGLPAPKNRGADAQPELLS
jgi:Holliday junction DNA helicase RuvB